jgi:hypothetical protein
LTKVITHNFWEFFYKSWITVKSIEKGSFRGSGKYKGKLPLKCFSCGKIGHYAKICPYAKNVENKDENSSRNFRSNRKFRNKSHKKSFLAKDCDSSDESDDSSNNDSNSESDDDSEPEKLMFMAMNSTKAPKSIISEDEGDLTEQLKSSLNKLGRFRLKYKAVKEENKDLIRERQSLEESISNFELQLEVSRRDEDRLLKQLQERKQGIERLQAEIISIRQLNNATQRLNEMISSQRPPSDKTGLGYEKHQENTKSNSQHHEHEKKGKEPQMIPLSNQSIIGQPPLLHQPVEQPPCQHQRYQPPLQQRQEQPSSQHQQYQPPRRNASPNFAPRYNFKFNGHCHYCGIFGHRIADCFKRKNVELRSPRMPIMNHNKFESLSSEIECPKCNNFGHTANNCRLDIVRSHQINWYQSRFFQSKPNSLKVILHTSWMKQHQTIIVMKIISFHIGKQL